MWSTAHPYRVPEEGLTKMQRHVIQCGNQN